ncbi:MAG: aminoacyl-tRNA hydrolase [Bacteroidota bacterium]|jgi:PTH1 family peptidyl-tRNA hydrolase
MQRFLIVGLGNPGPQYQHTRHNIGFDVVAAFVQAHGGTFVLGRLAEIATVKIKGREFVCIRPTTFMNLSGQAFRYWMEKENIPVEQTLTIVDDLALPLSKIRLRGSGSDAGHNGLKDIQQVLGTDRYPKLRFGIGNQFPKGGQVDFVLGRWLPEEEPIVQAKIKSCGTVIESFALAGLAYTMNMANRLEFNSQDSNLPPAK